MRAGAPISLRFADDRYPPMRGEVREVDPPHLLVYRRQGLPSGAPIPGTQ